MGSKHTLGPEFEFFLKLFGDGCWEWPGFRDPDGYGRFGANWKIVGAHRFAYETLIGPIPDGLELDHLCRNRACVNPQHLEMVVHAENMARTKKHYGDRCPYGHVLTVESAYVRKDRGKRETLICRQCTARRSREYKARQKFKQKMGERG